jgi:GMP synthase (glutamine-hydrolysing)
MKFLLLQARNEGDPAQPHEVLSFEEVLERPAGAIQPWSLLDGPPPGKVLDATDCVLVGGSGDYGVLDAGEHTWLAEFIQLMGDLAERGFPTFCSCFGFQAMCLALGGVVETDKARAEVGTFELTLTEHGQADPLFKALSPTFLAQLGHKDHVTKLPAGFVHLATSARSEFQAMTIPGKPVYATQFHPELSMTRNRERFLRYLVEYSKPDMADSPDSVLTGFRETPAATSVLRRYVDEILPRYL